MDRPGCGLAPLCTFVRHSNLQPCVTETNTVLSGQVAGIDLRDVFVMLHDSRSEDGMPAILCLLRVRGEIVAVLALGPRSTADDYTDGDQGFVMTHYELVLLLSDERLSAKIEWKSRGRGAQGGSFRAHARFTKILPL